MLIEEITGRLVYMISLNTLQTFYLLLQLWWGLNLYALFVSYIRQHYLRI